MKESTTVFVYGTLKGMDLHHFRSAAFIGHAVTVPEFLLFDGGFPLAVPGEDAAQIAVEYDRNVTGCLGHIIGEVYEVDAQTVQGLDDYEGYPSFYTRAEYPVKMLDVCPDDVTAWIYTGVGAKTGIPHRHLIKPEGVERHLRWPYQGEHSRVNPEDEASAA